MKSTSIRPLTIRFTPLSQTEMGRLTFHRVTPLSCTSLHLGFTPAPDEPASLLVDVPGACVAGVFRRLPPWRVRSASTRAAFDKPERNVQQNQPRTIAHMPSRREKLPETLARLGRSCRKLSMTGSRGGSLTTSAPVPGSPTPRELAMADECTSYRIGPWSSWGIRCKNRPARRQSGRQKSAKQSQLKSVKKHSPSKS